MELRDKGIAVFCGSSGGRGDAYLAVARELGRALAEHGATVVYGGASVGTMGAVADGALGAGGKVVGVIPDRLVKKELAHAALTELVVVETMHERKAIMSERAAGYAVLPGGYGTYEELFEVITWKQLGIHDKPIVILDVGGFYGPLLAQIDRAIAEGFMRPDLREYVLVVSDVARALAALVAYSAPEGPIGKWF